MNTPTTVRYRIEQHRVAYVDVPRIGDTFDTLMAANQESVSLPAEAWTTTELTVQLVDDPPDRSAA